MVNAWPSAQRTVVRDALRPFHSSGILFRGPRPRVDKFSSPRMPTVRSISDNGSCKIFWARLEESAWNWTSNLIFIGDELNWDYGSVKVFSVYKIGRSHATRYLSSEGKKRLRHASFLFRSVFAGSEKIKYQRQWTGDLMQFLRLFLQLFLKISSFAHVHIFCKARCDTMCVRTFLPLRAVVSVHETRKLIFKICETMRTLASTCSWEYALPAYHPQKGST